MNYKGARLVISKEEERKRRKKYCIENGMNDVIPMILDDVFT